MTLFLLMVAISTKRVTELRYSSFFPFSLACYAKDVDQQTSSSSTLLNDEIERMKPNESDEKNYISFECNNVFFLLVLSVNGTGLKIKTLPDEKTKKHWRRKNKQPPASEVAHLSRIIHLFFSCIDAVRQHLDLDLLWFPFWFFSCLTHQTKNNHKPQQCV